MKKTGITALLITNSIMVIYNNYFFAILEGVVNEFKENWALDAFLLSLLAFAIIVPTSLITRMIIFRYIARTSASPKKQSFLKIFGIVINAFIMVTIMMSFTKGFTSQEFRDTYLVVLGIGTVNVLMINLLFAKPIYKISEILNKEKAQS